MNQLGATRQVYAPPRATARAMPITEALTESLQTHPIYTWTVLGVVVLGHESVLDQIPKSHGVQFLQHGRARILHSSFGSANFAAVARAGDPARCSIVCCEDHDGVIADAKFITIFSMLFGAGIVLFSDRVAASGGRPVARFLPPGSTTTP